MDPDLTIVLLGRTGVGKSASANTILGRAALESKTSFKAVTTGIREETGRVFGKLIRVVDTPGVLGSQRQLRRLCGDVLGSSGPHLFLLVLSVGRFTADQEEALRAAVNAVGPRGLEKSFLLLTGGDLLKDRSLKDFVCEGGDGLFSEIVEQFDEAYHLFNNKDGGQEQVRELLLKAGDLPTGGAELRMVLIGRGGVGKSASGNTILGQRVFRSTLSSSPVTLECQKETSLFDFQKLAVVDTPGLFDTKLTAQKVKKEIARFMSFAAPGPHVFLIVVHPKTSTKEEYEETLRIIQKVFGDGAARYTMALFTHVDDLNVSIEEFIMKTPALRDLVRQCEGGYHVFNKRKNDPSQVRELLKKIKTMVQRNGGRYYSNEIFEKAESAITEEMERVKKEKNIRPQEARYKAERNNKFIRDRMVSIFIETALGQGVGVGAGIGIGAAVEAAVGADIGAAVGAIGVPVGAAVGAAVHFSAATKKKKKACALQ